MMRAGVRWSKRVVTGLGWVVVAANAHPQLDPAVTPGQAILAAVVAVAGTLASVIVHVQRPVEDVWQAGREYGRREAIREAQRAPSSLSARRRRKQMRELSKLG